MIEYEQARLGVLQEWTASRLLAKAPELTEPKTTLDVPRGSPQRFWAGVWKEALGREIEVPPPPEFSGKKKQVMEYYGFLPIFLPEIGEEDYPRSFVKPDWGHLDVNLVEHLPLPGRWVMVETIAKPDCIDPKGYGAGVDPLAADLGRKGRFGQNAYDLIVCCWTDAAELLGFNRKFVHLPTVEEWNLVGNLFLWLNQHRSARLPDLAATASYEWCVNHYRSKERLIIGSGLDGLPFVYAAETVECNDIAGFRLLVEL